MKILVTGGAGFIGTNFIRHMLETYKDLEIIVLDKLTYAGRKDNMRVFEKAFPKRFSFITGDICNKGLINALFQASNLKSKINVVVNFAAETMVDRSIKNSESFIQTNIYGVVNLLETIREQGCRLIQISTDEVYGSILGSKSADVNYPLKPKNPYSASKASSDLLVLSYINTYGIDAIITRSANNYGPYQHPEKFIPLAITNLILEKSIPIYGKGNQVREWLHVNDHCKGIDLALYYKGEEKIFNFGPDKEFKNIVVAKKIIKAMEKTKKKLVYINDRPGHDFRYSVNINSTKKELGWSPKISFDEGLKETIEWYKENKSWWLKVRDKKFEEYYQALYKGKV